MGLRVKEVFAACLRGFAQVMFQPSVLSGILFLCGIVYGSLECGVPQVAAGALAGCLAATLAGMLTQRRGDESGRLGLWGFNGTLIGCALPLFLESTWAMWTVLLLAAGLSPFLQRLLNGIMSRRGINSLTIPFVLISWVILLVAGPLYALSPVETQAAGGAVELTVQSLAIGWLKGVSQVFLIDSWVAGVLFVAALAVSSFGAAVWAALGSALAMGVAGIMGADPTAIAGGLYGFSAVLTAVALGDTFKAPGIIGIATTLAAVVVTVFVQAAMNALMQPWSLPTFTAPFCLATWFFLLLRKAPKA